MREHNRICDLILSKDPTFTHEQIYNAARNYVTALIQHITYDEFLPTLLGRSQFDSLIGPYISTNDDPTLSTEFSTAGFRLGHTFINAPFNLISNNGQSQ
jgi:peroxidase